MKDKKEMNEQKGTVAAVQPKKKKKKVLIIVLVIVALLAVLIGTAVHNMTKAVEMVMNTVEVEPVQLRDLSDTISLKGTIAGASSTNVTSKAVAEITAMNVQVGDIVQEGDVLCTLDSASIEEKIADLEKSVSNAQAVSSINSQQTQTAVQQALEDQETQLASAQRQVDDAQTNYNVAETQYNNGEIDFPTLLASKRALESAKASYDATLESTNRAIENAQLQVELDKYKDSDASSKDTLDSLREQLADCEVVAPCSGVVTSVNVRVGDINGEKVTILTIEDTSSLKLVATVDEADILKLQEGMAATVTADATGEEKINGTPDYETRMAILRKKVEADEMSLSDDILNYIATNIKSNIRELEGALNKLLAYSNLEKTEITMDIAIKELQNIITPDKPKEITPQLIIEVVSEHFQISLDQMISKNRSKDIARPRQIAMYLCKNMTDTPLDSIGALLGGRDHSTIIHGVQKISDEYESDDNTKNLIDTIKKKINPN